MKKDWNMLHKQKGVEKIQHCDKYLISSTFTTLRIMFRGLFSVDSDIHNNNFKLFEIYK